MPRPLWSGAISFGLVNIPVTLYSAEQSERSHFHLLDKKNKSRIHYERINDKSGKTVPWQDIVKAFEYEKDNYVVIDEKELERSDPNDFKTIDLKEFVEQGSIEFPYLEKPYYLLPSKQGEKGYALLMETLAKTKKAGIASLVIKTKQHIALLVPYRNILLLNILRFEDELKKPEELYDINKINKAKKISQEEIAMAERLVKSMSGKWNPKKYHNESHDLLKKWIENKIKRGRTVTSSKVAANEPKAEKSKAHGKKAGKVVDFMGLLKKSVEDKKKKHPHKQLHRK